MPATPVHHTATDDGTWDGPAQEKKLETPLTTKVGDDTFAWVDPEGDETTKTAWKFIHHFVSGAGLPGSASTVACSTGIGVLNGARKGTTVPDADRAGIWKHLSTHLTDAGVKEEDVPELKSAAQILEERAAGDNCNRCDGEGVVKINSEEVECPQCGGTGSGDNNATETQAAKKECPTCGGSGKIKDGTTTCPTCGGDGQVEETLSKRPPATAIRSELRNVPESRVSPRSEFELREVPNGTGGTNLRFTGFASVTGDDAAYEMEDWLGPWTESVSVGAFGKTLSEGADVAFLLNHQGMTLARTKPGTLKLSEVTDGTRSPVFGLTGLHTEASLDPQNMYVQAMRSAVERGDLDEMSFAFRVLRQEWNEDYTQRWINEVSVDKGDVSLVNYGANPTTGGTVAMRQRLHDRPTGLVSTDRITSLLRRSAIFRELRAGKVISSANSAELTKALDALHAADDADIPGIVRALQDIDTAVDDAQGSISKVLGVTDPDGDPKDLEPALVPPPLKEKQAVSDFGVSARSRLEALKYAPRRVDA